MIKISTSFKRIITLVLLLGFAVIMVPRVVAVSSPAQARSRVTTVTSIICRDIEQDPDRNWLWEKSRVILRFSFYNDYLWVEYKNNDQEYLPYSVIACRILITQRKADE